MRWPPRFTASVLAALVASCSPQPKQPTQTPTATPTAPAADEADPLDGLDADVAAVMAAYGVPGLSLVVVKDGEVVVAKGYGTKTLGKDDPVDGDTVFAIASNTKAFLATALGMLVAEEKIKWDDRVIDHLPELELWDDYTTQHIRVRDLLSHRSGLSTWAGDATWIGSEITNAQLLGRLKHVPPDHDLRETFGYSNLMFVVAGELLRVKTGKPWHEFVQDRLLGPLGMTRTSTTVAALPKMTNVATPYMDIDGTPTKIPYLSVDNAGASAALNSSVNDLAKWLVLQLGEGKVGDQQLVPPEVVADLRVPQTPIARKAPKHGDKTGHFAAYGLGWFLRDHRGAFVVTHGGGLPGMISRVTLVPEEELGIAVLTNSESGAAGNVANLIVDRYLGADPSAEVERAKQAAKPKETEPEEQEQRSETQPASVPVAKLAGKYTHALMGKAQVTLKDGVARLDLVDHGGLACPLAHQDQDQYDCRWDDPIFGESVVSFDVDKRRVKGLRFRVRPEFIDPLEYKFEKR